MILPNLTILEFAQLSFERRSELEHISKYIPCNYSFNCKEWTFISVKEIQTLLSKERTYENILEIIGYVNVKYKCRVELLGWVEVLSLFNEVEYQVTEINQIENNTLGDYNPTAKDCQVHVKGRGQIAHCLKQEAGVD